MMKPVITAVVLLMAVAPACAQAQRIGGLVGDVVGGAVGTADTAVRDVVGAPRRGYSVTDTAIVASRGAGIVTADDRARFD